jgi:hypothetical protein
LEGDFGPKRQKTLATLLMLGFGLVMGDTNFEIATPAV